MQNTESGRKINQAMVSTGRAVATTSKAVGGAISQAKGAFSSWWSNLMVSPEPVQKAVEAIAENGNGLMENGDSGSSEERSEHNNEASEVNESSEKHKTGEIHTV